MSDIDRSSLMISMDPSVASEKLAEAEEKIAQLESDLQDMGRIAERYRSAAANEHRKYMRAVNSARYKIGTKMTEIKKNPLKVFSVPFWVYKIMKEKPIENYVDDTEQLYTEKLNVKYPNITIAAIMDEFTYSCYKHECNIIRITKENYKREIENAKSKIDFLFVESAWRGNNDEWRYSVHNMHGLNETLAGMVNYVKSLGIPTVFWNKEDPVHYDDFNLTAGLFDYVFTTDEDCIPKYKEELGHDRVYLLMFAAQYHLHNPFTPIMWNRPALLNNVCFAGSYYSNMKYPERNIRTEVLCDAALKYGLDIYDRNSGHPNSAEWFKFPDKYAECIHPAIPYETLLKLHNRYKVMININSVDKSPTMFARRVFESLASGELILSSPSVGVEKLFGDVVCVTENFEEADAFLNKAINDNEFYERRRLEGLRAVHNGHSYDDRFHQILSTLSIAHKAPEDNGISAVVATNRNSFMENVFSNYTTQTCKNKQLIIVLNKNDMDIEKWRARAQEFEGEDITVIQLDENESLGACLNAGYELAKYDILTKMDDDDFYAPKYLEDMLMYFDFHNVNIIGKTTYTVYFEGSGIVAEKFPGYEFTYDNVIIGGTLTFRKSVWEDVKFVDRPRGTDTAFLSDAKAKGYNCFSVDRFNFVGIRRADTNSHTWNITDEEMLKNCTILNDVTDYKKYATV